MCGSFFAKYFVCFWHMHFPSRLSRIFKEGILKGVDK